MHRHQELRKHPRTPVNGRIRVSTSLVDTPYTVDIGNVSRGGLFIHSSHLPRLGETVTYRFLDTEGGVIGTGEGTVVRLVTKTREQDLGFAIRFAKELSDEQEQALLANCIVSIPVHREG